MVRSVWVVEQGSYSDYRVVGVFSSKANAQLIADEINRNDSDEATVDEWPLDPAVKDINAGRRQWIVNILRDGMVERCDQLKTSGYNLSGEVHMWRRSTAPAFIGREIKDCLQATVWATGSEHAIKIANDHRARMIADGTWDRDE